ncbi:MAG: hypothetical protein VX899_23370 [Myxococcota bacterium]|nr:hypothetical protein [Myxococcota bacterium]
MRIALATCQELPDWEVDDHPLHAAFRARGVELSIPVWDDPQVDWEQFDAVLIRTTWDYSTKHREFLAWVERVGDKLHNPPKVVQWSADKSYLRALAKEKIPTIPTIWLDRYQDLNLEFIWPGWERGFIKPQIGAAARETLRFSEAELPKAEAHIKRMLRSEDVMLQPYLDSVELEGELSAIFIDGRLSHGVQKLPPKGDYRVQDDHGGTDRPVDLAPKTVALCIKTLAATAKVLELEQPLLYARVDFLRGKKGQLLLTELELVEPSLFFRHRPQAAEELAEALLRRVQG